MVMDYIPEYNFRGVLVIEDNEHLKANHRKERMTARKLPAAESREYHNELALDFIRKYFNFNL